MTYNEYAAGIAEAKAAYNRVAIAADAVLDDVEEVCGGISSRDSARHLATMVNARKTFDATIYYLRSAL